MRVTNLVYLASAVALGVQAFPAPGTYGTRMPTKQVGHKLII